MSRSLAATFANVHDFDAVGDGLADDSLAIQAAIRNPFGKHVLFPAGVYRIGPAARLARWTDGGAGVEFDVDGQRARGSAFAEATEDTERGGAEGQVRARINVCELVRGVRASPPSAFFAGSPEMPSSLLPPCAS